jgi:hypothetical protein
VLGLSSPRPRARPTPRALPVAVFQNPQYGPGAGSSPPGDFDVSPDGRTLVFDRVRDESDIVRIDLAGR